MTICVFVLNSYVCVNKCYNLIIFNDYDFTLTNTKKNPVQDVLPLKKVPKTSRQNCPWPKRPLAKLSYNRRQCGVNMHAVELPLFA